MRIGFVNPGGFDSTQPPLGLGYLASYLRKYDDEKHNMIIVDENVGENSEKELLKFKPDVVGITSTTPQISRSMEIAEFVKENWGIPIVIGGAHPTSIPQQTVQEGKFDIVVIGEGELTFFEVIQTLKNGGIDVNKLKKVKGISFRDGKKIIHTESRPPIENLDDLPFPARDLMNMDFYLDCQNLLGQNITSLTQVMSSRGCPYRCIFCTCFVVNKRKFRPHSPEYTVSEVQELIKKYKKIKAIKFLDDTFLINKERVKNLLNLWIESGLHEKIKFGIQTRADGVREEDKELLKLLKMAGCSEIGFGFESGSPRILSLLKKNTTTVEDNDRVIKICNEVGIDVFGNFMIGTPSETKEDIEMTKKFIIKHKKNIAAMGVFITTPYPGTELWDICEKKGLLKGFGWKDYMVDNFTSSKNPRTFSDIIPERELIEIHRDMVKLTIEEYPMKVKIKKALTNPKKIVTLGLPYIFYKIKKIISEEN